MILQSHLTMDDDNEDIMLGAIIHNRTGVFESKTLTPRAVVAATCFLSMAGSLVTMFTFFAFKHLRNHTRHILLHLSLMDFGVAAANFIGAVVYFDKYYYEGYNRYTDEIHVSDTIHYSCKIQAAFAVTCNNSSVLWTIAVAVYLHFRIVTHTSIEHSKAFFRLLLCTLFIICYGLPVLLTVWLYMTNRIGFAPYDSAGWCTLRVLSFPDKTKDLYADVFGNDLWVLIAFISIPLLYFSIRFHTKQQYSSVNHDGPSKTKLKRIVDYKLTLIPLMFVLLRLGSVLVSVLFEYMDINPDGENIKWLSTIILYLSGIGDSAQGAVNGIMFVILTKPARNALINLFCCWKKKRGSGESTATIDSSGDESSPLLKSEKKHMTSYDSQKSERTLVIIQDT